MVAQGHVVLESGPVVGHLFNMAPPWGDLMQIAVANNAGSSSFSIISPPTRALAASILSKYAEFPEWM